MKFDLKSPCKDCPFRTDKRPFISHSRAREICHSITKGDQTFACHKTIEFDDDGEGVTNRDSQHCAGALILLEKINRPNQMMRIMERLGGYDRRKLKMDAPVYATPAAMIAAHKGKR